MVDLTGRPFNIEVPLDDGTTLVVAHDGLQTIRSSHTYQADGFSTFHNASCLQEPKFQEAYDLGAKSGHTLTAAGQELHCEWRVHQYIWAASHCKNLEGDFVECGVNTGIFSLAIMKYLEWNTIDKDFWLFDTYEGCPSDQYTAIEIANGVDKVHENSYFDCYDLAKKNFAPWSRAKLVKGRVPHSLASVEIDKVAYIMIDMNAVVPEIAAAEYFWPKMVSGAIMCLDDYGYMLHVNQKIAFDKFAEERGIKILNLPTGQGFLIKP